jgi:Ran GTPase-activating protein (RanGAP) involved in mRNA processing and transport
MDRTNLLADMLKTNNSIQTVEFHDCGLGDDELQILASALGSHAVLNALSVKNNSMGSPGIRALCESLNRCTQLRALTIRCKLADIPSQPTSIQSEPTFIPALVSLVQQVPLTLLSLERCALGADAARQLFQSLEENSSLRTLCVSENYMLGAGKAFASLLRKNRSLTHAYATSCSLSTDSGTFIAQAMQANKSIIQLELLDVLPGHSTEFIFKTDLQNIQRYLEHNRRIAATQTAAADQPALISVSPDASSLGAAPAPSPLGSGVSASSPLIPASDGMVSQLARLRANDPSLKTVDLSTKKGLLNADLLKEVCAELKKSQTKHVTGFTIKSQPLTPDLMRVICDMLIWNDSITHLNLSKCFQADQESVSARLGMWDMLSNGLHRHGTLQLLNLSSNGLSSASVRPLFEALSHTSIRTLDLSENSHLSSCMPSIIQLLQSTKTLMKLDVTGCDLFKASMCELFLCVSTQATLRTLDVSHNQTGEEAKEEWPALYKMLQFNRHLQHLVAKDFALTPAGWKTVAEAVKSNFSLLSIDLGTAPDVGPDEMKVINETLLRNTSEAGAAMLRKSIASPSATNDAVVSVSASETLTRISVHNGLWDRTLQRLRCNDVTLSAIRFGHSDDDLLMLDFIRAGELLNALHSNRFVTQLDFGSARREVREEELDAMFDMLKENTTLITLNLAGVFTPSGGRCWQLR